MNNKPDPFEQSLANLWQQQPVRTPDWQALKKQSKRIRHLQMYYLAADAGSVLFVSGMMLYVYDDLNRYGLSAFLVILLGLLAFVIYMARIRLASIHVEVSETQDFIHKLVKQQQNHLLLLKRSKQSLVPSCFFVVGFHILQGYGDNISAGEFFTKLGWSLLLLGVLGVGYWLWASKRERKLKQQLASMEQLLDDSTCQAD